MFYPEPHSILPLNWPIFVLSCGCCCGGCLVRILVLTAVWAQSAAGRTAVTTMCRQQIKHVFICLHFTRSSNSRRKKKNVSVCEDTLLFFLISNLNVSDNVKCTWRQRGGQINTTRAAPHHTSILLACSSLLAVPRKHRVFLRNVGQTHIHAYTLWHSLLSFLLIWPVPRRGPCLHNHRRRLSEPLKAALRLLCCVHAAISGQQTQQQLQGTLGWHIAD